MLNYSELRAGFQEFITPLVAPTLYRVASGDLNRDGLKDLIFIDLTLTSRGVIPAFKALRVALANVGDAFVETTNVFSNTTQNSYQNPHILIDDFTGDRLPDMVVYDAGY